MIEENGDQPPYPGLRAFTRDESMLFFGRENCVDSMIDRLAATRFLAVLGASGSGKSSLVRTGLLDGLELGFFARAGSRWKIVETHPGGAPIHNLAVALAGDVPEAAAETEDLLRRGRRSIIEWAGEELEPGENLLILVDQFEELFRYADYAAREEAESFVALLLESARSSEHPIYVVMTMRSEYIGACALISGLTEQVNASFYLAPRMSREECRQAIEGPAAVLGFTIEPALTNRILNDMAGFAPWEEERGVTQGQILSRRSDQLPLMQHLLNRLWLRARARRGADADDMTLTAQDYDAVGGLTGALNSHGAEVLASLDDADRRHVSEVFRALISGPDPTNAVRRPCRFGELEDGSQSQGASTGTTARIVNAFRSDGCNFLQPAAEVPLTRDLVIDISHESLIRQWTTLAEWLREEARADANWRRLRISAERYSAGEGDLLTGLDLASLVQWWDAEEPSAVWASRHGGDFPAIAAFLESSREVETRRTAAEETRKTREQRGRLVMTSLIVVLIPCLLMLGFTWWSLQRSRAEAAAAEITTREKMAAAERAQEKLKLLNGEIQLANKQIAAADEDRKNAGSKLDKAVADKRVLLEKAEAAQKKLTAAQLAFQGLLAKNPAQADIFNLAKRANDVCNRNRQDAACKDIFDD